MPSPGRRHSASPELALAQASPTSTPRSPGTANGPTAPAISFADSLRLPLEPPILQQLPPMRATREDVWVPKRSNRLAAKSAFRDPQPERQAKRVLLSKWSGTTGQARSTTPDAVIAARFHDMFVTPLSSSKRDAMRELFPTAGVCGSRCAVCLL